jgi:hypothetical protein
LSSVRSNSQPTGRSQPSYCATAPNGQREVRLSHATAKHLLNSWPCRLWKCQSCDYQHVQKSNVQIHAEKHELKRCAQPCIVHFIRSFYLRRVEQALALMSAPSRTVTPRTKIRVFSFATARGSTATSPTTHVGTSRKRAFWTNLRKLTGVHPLLLTIMSYEWRVPSQLCFRQPVCLSTTVSRTFSLQRRAPLANPFPTLLRRPRPIVHL